ncbi:MAG: DUF3617 domain-containing protein [Candidatus Contendobacter sp.]|jgi:hypothetical protein|nr:DUF3617 family protein [Gammaproteobacteria bacterium]MCC8993803.1 DUF3617 domain-containing protein [Candidatus Contendobacter sp.]
MMINRFALNTPHPRWIAAILLAVSMNGIAEDIQPGLWRITLESRVAATPDWNPEPFQLSQCLTTADAQNPEQLLVGLSTSGVSGCEFLNRQASGQRLQFEVRCGGALGIQGQGTVDFTATTVAGVLNAHFAATDDAAEAVEMQNQLQAVYVGPCPAGGGTP